MAVTNEVLTAAQTNTLLDEDARNPTQTNTTGVRIVHVTLKFKNLDFIPNDLYDALDAEWPTVTSDKSSQSHNIFEFTISA